MNGQRTIAFALAALQMGILVTTPAAWGQHTTGTNTKSDRQTEEQEWTGRRANGTVLTRAGLDEILSLHKRYLETDGKEGELADLQRCTLSNVHLGRANLSKAILSGANLTGADLSGANLTNANLAGAELIKANLIGAELIEANLTEANLSEANLSEANLTWSYLVGADLTRAGLEEATLTGAKLVNANLTEAVLQEAKLTGADLTWAKLNRADLSGANLTGAELQLADLSGAILRDTDLTDAKFSGADLDGAVFEPKPNSLPYIPYVASARNLDKLRYEWSEAGLVELRTALREAGLRRQEREVNYAFQRCRRQKMWDDPDGFGDRVDAAFNYVFFEITCKYGLLPGRPLQIMGVAVLAFAAPYFLVLRRKERSSRSDIWLEVEDESIRANRKRKRRIRLLVSAGAVLSWRARVKRFRRALFAALYFSLLTAFRVGFREINVGNWIARMQFREYTIRATGWVRFVTGLQSLISVALLGLWLVTYFGRPFE